MHPILWTFTLGERAWPLGSYGVALVLAVASAALLFVRLGRGLGVGPAASFEGAVVQIGGGLVGAKALGVLVALFAGQSLGSWRAAGVVHGGIFGGIAASVWLSRRMGLGNLRVLDWCGAPVALGQGVGRLGCFLAGCCYGRPDDGPWSIVFTSERAHAIAHTPLHVPLFPVQLVDGAAHLLLALVLASPPLRVGQRRPGITLFAWLFAEGVLRFVIESFRGDLERGTWGFWSTGRITATLLMAVGLLGLAALARATPGGSSGA